MKCNIKNTIKNLTNQSLDIFKACEESFVTGEDPVKTWFNKKFFYFKVISLKLFLIIKYIDIYFLQQKSDSSFFNHRMFYERRDGRFTVKKNAWLLSLPGITFIIENGSSLHKDMINNTINTTAFKRRRIFEYVKYIYFANMLIIQNILINNQMKDIKKHYKLN